MRSLSTLVFSRLRIVCERVFAALLLLTAMLAFEGRATAQTSEPTYSFTYFEVETANAAQAAALMKAYRSESRREEGNLEFVVMQGIDRSNHFVIVEGWTTAAASTKHEQSAATAAFSAAWAPIRISPPDKHVVEPFALGSLAGAEVSDAIYMVEHIDFMPAGRDAAPPLVTALAEGARKEAGALRFDVFRQLARRNNHYQVVSKWVGKAAFEAHEIASFARRFRAESSLGKPAQRANLYDQRLYREL